MKKKIIALIVMAVVLSVGFFSYYGYTPNNITSVITQPQFKDATSYDTGNSGYECSKPIRLQRQRELVGHMGGNSNYEYLYLPVNSDEANLFCHGTWVEEYKGKLTVLQKPEVLALIGKYQYKDVSIKAIEFKYIEDKDFVYRLLPAYKNKEIGCIIVLETPGEKKVYLEDDKLQTFEELDYKIFEKSLLSVSESDRKLFEDNLK